MTRPSLRTKITSAVLTVERRCAMTKDVRPSINSLIAVWMRISVMLSTFDVASSRISTGAFEIIARAMVRSCF